MLLFKTVATGAGCCDCAQHDGVAATASLQGVGAVDGGIAAGQRIDLIDELRRDLIEIGGHLFEAAVDGLNLEFKLCAKFNCARRALL